MIYVIIGPTGSGKTDISKSIAHHYDLPIINGDAFQIYQEMDIGTAKIDKSDVDYSRHYLIDIVSPNKPYSVKEYQRDFRQVLDNLSKKYKNVIVSGGTGLYIRAALYDYSFPEQEEIDLSKYDKYTNEQLAHQLNKVDPEALKTIHVNNRKRLLRALAIAETGLTKTDNISSQEHKLIYDDVEFLFLNPDREKLYEKINLRVDHMFEMGLVEEVKSLINKYDLSLTASQAIGYKEVIEYLNGTTSLVECKELIKKRSRNYAKRQVTFFKHQFIAKEFSHKEEIVRYLEEKLKK